jgi:integration host factor subunit beta
MLRSELIGQLAKEFPGIAVNDLERNVATIFESMIKALEKGRRIELRGFGTLSVRVHPARIGRNPKTGDAVSVPAKRTPAFKAGKELRDRLNAITE